MILKRDKEESEKLDPKDKEKLEAYKKGVAGGVTGVAVGGLTAALGHAFIKRVKENGQGEVQGKIREGLKELSDSLSEENIRRIKAGGKATAGAGAVLATAAGIAYGVKKRKVRKAEEKKDDSKEK